MPPAGPQQVGLLCPAAVQLSKSHTSPLTDYMLFAQQASTWNPMFPVWSQTPSTFLRLYADFLGRCIKYVQLQQYIGWPCSSWGTSAWGHVTLQRQVLAAGTPLTAPVLGFSRHGARFGLNWSNCPMASAVNGDHLPVSFKYKMDIGPKINTLNIFYLIREVAKNDVCWLI